MRTFDLAIKYLKDVDLSHIDINDDKTLDSELMNGEILKAFNRYKANPENNKSNDYYKGGVFISALIHLVMKANNFVSFWDVSREIIQANKEVLNTNFKRYLGTVYPEVMCLQWNKYCTDMKKQTTLLEGEINSDLFFCAYEYFINPEKA